MRRNGTAELLSLQVIFLPYNERSEQRTAYGFCSVCVVVAEQIHFL